MDLVEKEDGSALGVEVDKIVREEEPIAWLSEPRMQSSELVLPSKAILRKAATFEWVTSRQALFYERMVKVGEDVTLTDSFRDGVRVLVGLRQKPKELILPLTN